jgi:hypothetical protein
MSGEFDGLFVFEDGATQSFTAEGRTTYVERGVPSDGEWSVAGDGTFAVACHRDGTTVLPGAWDHLVVV